MINPLVSIEGENEHQFGIKVLAMNKSYIASYSEKDNLLLIRDWEWPNDALFRLDNFNDQLNLNIVNRR